MADAQPATPEAVAQATTPADPASAADGVPPEGTTLADKLEDTPKKHVPNPHVKEFAALTRKEREVRALITQQKQDALAIAQFRQLASNPKANIPGIMKMLNLTYDDVTEHYATGGQSSPEGKIRMLEERDAAREKELSQLVKKLEEREEASAKAEFVGAIRKIVDNNPDLELVRAFDAYGDVYEVIDLHYRKTGEIMEKEEAAEKVERYLFNAKSEEAAKLLGVKKLKQKLGMTEKDSLESAATKQPPSGSQPTKTITNELVQATAHPQKPTRPLTDDEAWAAAKARTLARLAANKK